MLVISNRHNLTLPMVTNLTSFFLYYIVLYPILVLLSSIIVSSNIRLALILDLWFNM